MTATSLTKIVFPRQLFFLSTNHVDASDSTSMANHHPPNQSAADLEPGRLARAYRQVVILLFLALPLLMLLRWAVEVFPNDLDWNFLTPIDERYVLIQRESMLQGWSKTGALNRYLVLDSASGQVTQLSKVIATSVQPDHVQVLPRGRLLWTTPKHAASVHVTEFRSGQTARYLLSDQPILIGKRFEICTSPLALISWLDLDASRPTLETSQVTCYSQVTPLRDASVPAFYDLYQVQKIGGVDLSEMEGMMPAPEAEHSDSAHPFVRDPEPDLELNQDSKEATETIEPGPRPEWDLLLSSPQSLPTQPHPAFTHLQMLVLYHMTEAGPQEIAHWPIGSENQSYGQVQSDGPYLFCLSLDAKFIDVHLTSTGAIVSQIPLPAFTGPPSSVNWDADRSAVRIYATTPITILDPLSQSPLAVDPTNPRCHVVSRGGNRYLTVASGDPTKSIGTVGSWPLKAQFVAFPAVRFSVATHCRSILISQAHPIEVSG